MQRTYPPRVDDLLTQIKHLLEFEASRRRAFQVGPKKRPNARAIAKFLGVHPTTVQRILKTERNVEDPEAAQPYDPSPRLEQGLMRLLGVQTREELYLALRKTPKLRKVV